jgi:hypothetical protein
MGPALRLLLARGGGDRLSSVRVRYGSTLPGGPDVSNLNSVIFVNCVVPVKSLRIERGETLRL